MSLSYDQPLPESGPLVGAAQTGNKNNLDRVFAKKRNEEYPWQIWWCLAVFFCLVSFFQLVSYASTKLAAQTPTPRAGDESGGSTMPRLGNLALRRLPTAVTNSYRVVAFRWTVSLGGGYTLNVAEVILTILYIVALFTWSFINTTDTQGNHLVNRYWSNRTGTLAISQLPLVTALGTKNNLISLLTGVSYDKLNYMHRMTSRVTFVLIWVHGIGRITKGIPGHEWDEGWLRSGVMAAVGLTIICLLSVRPVRAKKYELFFYVHFFSVLAFLIGSYFHARYFHFDPYIIACFIIWGADRLIRIIRLVIFNSSYFGWRAGSGTLDARAELLSGDMVRLTLRRPPHFHWLPGQSAYLIMPAVSTLPFEAHPFTIASFDSSLDRGGSERPCSVTDGANEKDYEASQAMSCWKDLVFLINAQDGCTRRLLDIAGRKRAIKVFVDGPYGPSPDLRRFTTSILVAGGSGISHAMPILLSIIENARLGKTRCTKVMLVWAIREIAHLNWVSETLHKALILTPPSLDLSIRICITSQHCDVLDYDTPSVESQSADDVDTPQSEKTTVPVVLNMSGVEVSAGRPDLKVLLQREVEQTQGRMVVSVCGSLSIASAVRDALSFPVSSPMNILRGGTSVTLHIESFVYA